MPQEIDVRVTGGGSMYHVTPLTEAAKEWVNENVHLEDWQWLGSGFGVEWRYLDNLVEGMTDAGLTVSSA